MKKICPKCAYRRTAEDQHVHADICPSCGIAYNKWVQPEASQNREKDVVHKEFELHIKTSTTLRERALETLLYVPEKIDPLSFYGRVIGLVVFSMWGASFILTGIDWQAINGSFMHNINLPFHEFGHVLFGPFGRFMQILGGSLFQILMPLGLMFAFLIQRRDTFAASLMLWWCGQNMIDVSPYIADAPYRAMPLIRGMGEGAHDWGNLLTMTNALDSAEALANLSFGLGSLLIVSSMAWGAYVLMLQRHRLE